MNLLNKLTLKNLKLNKKRTIVTIIGIMLSVALITAVAAMFFSARASFIKYETREKGNYHYVFYNVPVSDMKYFKGNRNIEKIYYTSDIGYAELKNSKNDYKPYAFIKAFDSDSLKNLSINLVSGRLPENDTEILIPTHLKTNGRIEYNIGDTLELEVGKRFRGEEELTQSNPFVKEEDTIETEKIVNTTHKKYTIVGIMERPTNEVEEYSAPGYTFATILNSDNQSKTVDIYVRYTKNSLKNEPDVTADILEADHEAFKYVYFNNAEFDEKTYQKQLEKLGELKYNFKSNKYLITLETGIAKDGTMKALANVAIIVVVIIIFTSVFCIKNSFNISITEKIKQYGMLSTIGATSKQIKKNVYCEALMLGIVGIPLGIICGLLASYILIIISDHLIGASLGLNLIYKFSWLAIIFAIILGLITLFLSAWSSAHKASKITPIIAVRNSEDIKINAKKVKSPKYIKKIFGIGGDVSYKNLKRNKKKYRATVISIIVCVSVFIALYSFISLAFNVVKTEFEASDYNIQLTYNLKNKDLKERISDIENFEHINDYSITSSEYLSALAPDLSINKEYLKYFPDIKDPHTYEDDEGKTHTEYSEISVLVFKVGKHAYNNYLNKLGISEEEAKNKTILYDSPKTWVEDEKTKKSVEKIIPLFDYKKGDKITLKMPTGEYEEKEEKSIEKEISFDIAYVTDKLPFGFSIQSMPLLIISDSYFEELFYNKTNLNYETFSIDSTNATKLQDEIEEHLKNFEGDYSLTNIEESVKSMRSLYILVAIFLYGFIIVIALIGITNIFNTITTNMELRSSEFATLKSIGMTKKEFNRMISLESFFYGTKSLIIGIPIGIILSIFIYQILSEGYSIITYKIPIVSIIISILAVFILITCIMKYSINKINKQNTIETIRNENI